jgi:hypothetical protein
MPKHSIETRKTVTLTIDQQVLMRMALNNRIQWLTRTLRVDPKDALITECVDMLATLDAIPVFPTNV